MVLSNLSLSYDAFQAVEIFIQANTTQRNFPFPDLPYLRSGSAKIKAIEIYTPGSITNSPVSGTALNTIAEMKKCSLTLYGGKTAMQNIGDGVAKQVTIKEGNQIIQQVPLVRLNNLQNSATDPFTQNIFLLNGLDIDWTKSFIQYAANPANGSDAAYCFGVYFDWTNKQFN